MFFDRDCDLCDYLVLKNPTLWQAMGHGHTFKLIIAEKKGNWKMDNYKVKDELVNCTVFKNEEFGAIRALKENGEWLVSIKDFGEMLGYRDGGSIRYSQDFKYKDEERIYRKVEDTKGRANTLRFVKSKNAIEWAERYLDTADDFKLRKLCWLAGILVTPRAISKATKSHKGGAYSVDYTYLEDGDGGYSEAIGKIETVARYLNSKVGESEHPQEKLETILAILEIEEEEECGKKSL